MLRLIEMNNIMRKIGSLENYDDFFDSLWMEIIFVLLLLLLWFILINLLLIMFFILHTKLSKYTYTYNGFIIYSIIYKIIYPNLTILLFLYFSYILYHYFLIKLLLLFSNDNYDNNICYCYC